MPVPSSFWVRWMLLTTVGLAVGLVAGFGLGAPTVAIVGMMLVVTVIGAILGGVSGAVQSLALPPNLRRRGSWSLATAVGMAVGLTVGTVGGEQLGFEKGNPVHEALFIAIVGLATGGFAGLAQLRVLRGRMSTPGLWVPASALASGLGFLIGGLAAVAVVGGFRSLAGLAIVGVAGGVLSGALGGLILGRLAGKPMAA
ncbi:MAG TPA: hypothetical protein VLG15_03830 [Thermoanaerobaculia bacterium]|nr:hypothetical protein [Thermoanaerobaculia bacterium]